MMASGDYFTYEERQRLATLFGAGYSRDTIAELMERSRSCIDRQCARMGLVRRPPRKEPLPPPRKDFEAPHQIKNDHLAHCQAVMGADCPGSPHGYGFPHIAPLPALSRLVA